MPLTNDQSAALKKMVATPESASFILKGYAGTGKTYLLHSFLNEVTGIRDRVVITATTHKALGIAAGDFTIHSYLGLKLTRKFGRKKLETSGKHKIEDFDTVIVDECSMLNKDVLGYLLEAQRDYNLTLIFIGDPAQIPPVNETISEVFNLPCDSFTLTEIVRQAADNPIIKLATAIREGRATRKFIKDCADDKHIIIGNGLKAKEFFAANYSEESFPQIISFRNSIVDGFNNWARKEVKNSPKNLYIAGEPVYIRSTHQKAKFRLEDFVTIEEILKVDRFKFPGTTAITIATATLSGVGKFDTLLLPFSNRDISQFKSNCSALATRARTQPQLWKDFWNYTDAITIVKHIYAMTAHRSQGSTFKDVIVNYPDICQNNNLLYTSVTRASDRVFMII